MFLTEEKIDKGYALDVEGSEVGLLDIIREASIEYFNLEQKLIKREHTAIVNEDTTLRENAITDFFKKAIEWLKKQLNKLKSWFKKMFTKVQNTFQSLEKYYKNNQKALKEVQSNPGDYIKEDETVKTYPELTMDTFKNFSDSIKTETEGIKNAIENDVNKLTKQDSDKIKSPNEILKAIVDPKSSAGSLDGGDYDHSAKQQFQYNELMDDNSRGSNVEKVERNLRDLVKVPQLLKTINSDSKIIESVGDVSKNILQKGQKEAKSNVKEFEGEEDSDEKVKESKKKVDAYKNGGQAMYKLCSYGSSTALKIGKEAKKIAKKYVKAYEQKNN